MYVFFFVCLGQVGLPIPCTLPALLRIAGGSIVTWGYKDKRISRYNNILWVVGYGLANTIAHMPIEWVCLGFLLF